MSGSSLKEVFSEAPTLLDLCSGHGEAPDPHQVQLLEQQYCRSSTVSHLQDSLLLLHDRWRPQKITACIVKCTTWKQVQTILLDQEQSLNHINVAAALCHMAHLHEGNAEESMRRSNDELGRFLEHMALLISSMEGKLEGRQVANIMWAWASLGHSDKVASMLDLSLRHVHTYNSQQISNILWAVANMTATKVSQEWTTAFIEAAGRKLEEAEPQHLCNIGWSAAKLKGNLRRVWVDAFIKAASRKMSECSARDLSMLAWAVEHCGGAPGQQFWGTLVNEMQLKMTQFNCQDLLMCLWALTDQGVRMSNLVWTRALQQFALLLRSKPSTGETFVQIFGVMAKNEVPLKFVGMEMVDVLVELACSKDVKLTLDAFRLAEVVGALGSLKYEPSEKLGAILLQRTEELMEAMDLKELSHTVYGVACMNLEPKASWLEAFGSRYSEFVPLLSSEQCAEVLWAWCRLCREGTSTTLLKDVVSRVVELCESSNMHITQLEQVLPQHGNMEKGNGEESHPAGPGTGSGQALQELIDPSRDQPGPSLTLPGSLICCKDLSSIMCSLGHLCYPLPQQARQCLIRTSLALLQQSGPQELSNSIWALARLGTAGGEVEATWLNLWLSVSQDHLPDFQPIDLAQSMWALAVLRYQPGDSWFSCMLVNSYRKLTAFGPQDLSNLIWGMAHLGLTPAPAWSKQWLQVLVRRLEQTTPQQLSNCIWGMAMLKEFKLDAWQLRQILYVSFKKLPQYKPQEVSNTLWALASLNVTVDAEWLDEVIQYVESYLEDFSPKELSNVVYALGKLGAQVDAKTLHAMFKRLRLQVQDYIGVPLALSVYGLGTLGYKIDEKWLTALLLKLTRKVLGNYSHKEVNLLLQGMVLMSYKPPILLLESIIETSTEQRHSYPASCYAHMLYAFARFRFQPKEAWVEMAVDKIVGDLDSLLPSHIGMAAYGLFFSAYPLPEEVASVLVSRMEEVQDAFGPSPRRLMRAAKRRWLQKLPVISLPEAESLMKF